MKASKILVGILFLGTALMSACEQSGDSDGNAGNSGSQAGSGGSASGGGVGSSRNTTASGGTTNSGAKVGSGGSVAGGSTGNGGSGGNTTASGGATNSGGKVSSGGSAAGGSTGSGGSAGSGGAQSTVGGGASGGNTGSGGVKSTGGSGSGGTTASTAGGSAGSGGATGGNTGNGGSTGGLPPLSVKGTELQANGKKVILRGTSLIDIGALYAYNGNSVAGIIARMEKVAAAGLQGHVVRFPVYPKIDYNGGYPACSPLPYPVGTGPGTSCTPNSPMSAADYVSKVLKPAVDYATSKNLYVIIDHHQIDNASSGTSLADAKTFWIDVAPKFASYSNVLFEPFNEPIDYSASWSKFKPSAQALVDAVRAGAPDNVIIVPSMVYCQKPGDAASDPPTGKNLMYTAHVYPGNWNADFKAQITTAASKAPVFLTEWGYIMNNTSDKMGGTTVATWGTDFEQFVDSVGASWTAWVTDNQWTPSMFSNSGLTTLTDFGTLTKNWLAKKASSDWVQ